ncbi:MAG TPA: ABC transporter permease [Vicinamibacterales bacterium]|nr:ABC transporter permease [Vicinamibacterales bacterium]
MKDLRFAVRMLARQPAFTAVAVITLALGIGANTAIFTLFNAVLLQSLPVRDPARLVLFDDSVGEGTSTGDAPTGAWHLYSYEVYEFLKGQPLPLEGLAAVRSGEAGVAARIAGSTGAQAERAQAHLVSGNYFAVMGVQAALGRTLTPDDDRASSPPAAVVSHGFWVERLHADPGIVGRVATINGTAFTIAGVLPADFFGERVRRPPDFWVPLAFQPQVELRASALDRKDTYWLSLIGRLSPGATRAGAQAAATAALQRFLTAHLPEHPSAEQVRKVRESRIELANGAAGVSSLRYRYSQPLRVLLVVVALVLGIACANVANLLLTRAAARQPELTVRMALGASRRRIAAQLLVECLLLAAAGGACGIVLAQWVAGLLFAVVASKTVPVHPTLDIRVLAFTIAATSAAAVLFGLVPALTGARSDLVSALKSGGRGTTGGGRRARLARTMVAAQIAISLVLLVGASLFARSLVNLERQPLGFQPDGVLLARINPRLAGYRPENVADLYRRLEDHLATMPGIRSATIARYSPLGGSRSVNSGTVEGFTPKPGENVEFETLLVGRSYPETLGMPLVKGRAIGVQDSESAPPVAMVNEAFVRTYSPDRDPIGRRISVDGSGGRSAAIVGVLADARFRDDREPIQPAVFTALQQERSQFALDAEVEVATAGDPAAAAAPLRRAIAEVDPNLPINDPRTLRSQVDANFDSQRLAARLVGAFGLLAVVLSVVGLYGVLTQSVVQRTNELGVRMALGAESRQVIWMILRETLALAAIGIVCGVPAAYAAARLVASQLYAVSATAPASFGAATVALAAIAVATGVLPAVRAARVDPMAALREQ